MAVRPRALDRLALLWQRFTPVETQLLTSVSEALAAPARALFEEQVRSTTRVQRLPGWTEILLYRMRRGRVDWRGVALFPRTGEFPLAEVRMRVRGTTFEARLGVVHGHLFDIGIHPSPRVVAFAPFDEPALVSLLADPMDGSAAPVREPVPRRWSAFLAHASSERPSGWSLHGEGDLRRVTLSEGVFLVLAERRGEDFLLYRLAPEPPAYFVQHGPDGSPEPFSGDFEELLEGPGAGPSACAAGDA